jgi:simple sugar transport system permease protein
LGTPPRATESAAQPAHAPQAPSKAPHHLTLHSSRYLRLVRRPELGALVGCVVVYVIFAVIAGNQGFVSFAATGGILNVAAQLGIVATPVGLLVIAGEIDLSVGSVIGFAQIAVPIGNTFYHVPMWAMIALAMAFGAAVGALNGIITVRTGLPSFIVTLGTWFAVYGLGLGLSLQLANTSSVSLGATPRSVIDLFGSTYQKFQVSILWWLAITAVASVILFRTRFGNWCQATGGDSLAARSAGVPTGRVKISVFIACGMSAALVGVIQVVQYGVGNPTAGVNYVFEVIIAVVVGGVLLTGGYGSTIGVALGTLTYAFVSTGVFYTGWNTNYSETFLGVLLLLAVLANNYWRKGALTLRRQGG